MPYTGVRQGHVGDKKQNDFKRRGKHKFSNNIGSEEMVFQISAA
jgi:hypothetical protein